MARPRVQFTGQVVQVDPASIGPVVRSGTYRLLRLLGTLFVGLLFLVLATTVAALKAIAAPVFGDRVRTRRAGPLRDYLGDFVAHLAAARVASSGQTLITVARVRDSAGQVLPVRFQGHLISGSVAYGDSVTLCVRVVDGVRVVTDGVNHTTREAIRIRQ